jgi:iron complex outermembrane receptor protein
MNVGISRSSRIGSLAISCVAALVCVEVQAQAEEALEEIIVTAKRRSEDVQKTSVSATVLNQDLLESKGVVDLFALQYAAPAVTVTQYGSANVFNIRGLGRSQVDIDVPSGVVIYRDGTPTLAGYFQRTVLRHGVGGGLPRPAGNLRGQERSGRRGIHQHQRSQAR